MKFIYNLLFPFIKSQLLKQLKDDSNKEYIIKELSELITIPNLDSEKEKEILGDIYNAIEKVLENYIKD